MNENFQAWMERLRDPNAKQATGELIDETDTTFIGVGFCCLGHACDISKLGEWHGTEYKINDEYSTGLPPRPVARWLGIEDSPHLTFINELSTDEDTWDIHLTWELIEKHAPEKVVSDMRAYYRGPGLSGKPPTAAALNDRECPQPIIADILEELFSEAQSVQENS